MNEDILFFISVGAAIAGQLLDCITTEAGLARGWTELNPFSKKVISKAGTTALIFIKCIGLAQVLPIGIYVLGNHGKAAFGTIAGTIVAFFGAAIGLYDGIGNYRKLKAANISVF